MRAAVLRSAQTALSIEDVVVAEPEPNEVLVRTRAVGLCRSDLHFLDGTYPIATPAVLGHEAAGVVAAVGRAVQYVDVGDHVVTCLSASCGSCEFCTAGRPALCDRAVATRPRGAPPRLSVQERRCRQLGGIGAFAELMLVHENALAQVPRDVPFDTAALLGCAVLTGLGAVFHTARVEPCSTVVVVGCGGVGLSCIQGARIAGATRVVAVDVQASKLDVARRLGATDAIDSSREDPVHAVRELLPSAPVPGIAAAGGADHAFEAVGAKRTVEQAFAMLRKGGTATVVGMVPPGVKIELPGSEFQAEKRIQGSLLGSSRFRHDVARYVDLYRDGRLRLDELVSARLGLDDINDGFAALRRASEIRTLVIFE